MHDRRSPPLDRSAGPRLAGLRTELPPRSASPDPAPYTTEYFNLAPGDDVLAHMRRCLETTPSFFRDIPDDLLSRAHQAGEWTIKQILLHISDDERIYAYRTLRFARNNLTELPSFDQEIVAAHSGADSRSLTSLVDEFITVRQATLSLFENLPDEALARTGTGNGNPMSVRAAAFHIAGHELHHLESVRVNSLT